ncbi:MAG TPA: hypothetical protein VFF73_14700 [Planctomycetota bacterium]|nr:hypothetical protein [Planctomycetota bacterium]
MIQRLVRVDPALLDGPVMDRGGVTYLRLLVKKPARSDKPPEPLKVLELRLTDLTGQAKRERVGVAIFYDGSIVVAATFTLRLTLTYKDVEGAEVEVLYEPATRRARVRFATRRGQIEAISEVNGPDVGQTSEYREFLDAPPDEQTEIAVSKEGVLTLPDARPA